VCNCLIQFLLTTFLSIEELFLISAQRLSERTVSKASFSPIIHVTNIYLLANTSPWPEKLCSCTHICHLSVSHRLSVKVKVQFALEQTMRTQRVIRGNYSSILSLASALGWSKWSTPHPGRFTPGKEIRYPLYRRLGGPQSRSGRVRKISPLSGIDSHTFP
jgi:hypothetical protein